MYVHVYIYTRRFLALCICIHIHLLIVYMICVYLDPLGLEFTLLDPGVAQEAGNLT